MMILREPNDRELLTAQVIVRTLRGCGDDEEKQTRFVGHVLRDYALVIDDHRATADKLRRMVRVRSGNVQKCRD